MRCQAVAVGLFGDRDDAVGQRVPNQQLAIIANAGQLLVL